MRLGVRVEGLGLGLEMHLQGAVNVERGGGGALVRRAQFDQGMAMPIEPDVWLGFCDSNQNF